MRTVVVEVDWQHKLVKQLQSEGAYARKASSSYAVGVLDIDAVIPVYGAMKIEVKLLKGLNRDKPWSRKIEYTEKQKEEAANVIKAKGMALGLVFCHYDHMNVDVFVHLLPAMKVDRTLTSEEVKIHGKLWRSLTKIDGVSGHIFSAWVNKRT